VLLEGITIDPEKLEVIRKSPTPKNKQEIGSFLGLYTYYRRFISDFANIVKQLTNLRRRSKPSSELQKWRPPSRH
jgi:hypothetical protein